MAPEKCIVDATEDFLFDVDNEEFLQLRDERDKARLRIAETGEEYAASLQKVFSYESLVVLRPKELSFEYYLITDCTRGATEFRTHAFGTSQIRQDLVDRTRLHRTSLEERIEALIIEIAEVARYVEKTKAQCTKLNGLSLNRKTLSRIDKFKSKVLSLKIDALNSPIHQYLLDQERNLEYLQNKFCGYQVQDLGEAIEDLMKSHNIGFIRIDAQRIDGLANLSDEAAFGLEEL